MGILTTTEFAEALPDQCPPGEATDCALSGIFRLVHSASPIGEDFLSHNALGKRAPSGVDECRWASCSLTRQPKQLKLLRKLKHTHAAYLEIPEGAGRIIDDEVHVDFWRYAEFDVTTAIVRVDEL